MLAILFAHAVATALAPLLVYRWGRMAFYPLSLVPLGSLVWVALNWPDAGQARSVNVEWVPELSMDITPSVRRARGDHERAGAGHRRAGALLLRRLLPSPRRAHRKAVAQFRRRAGRVLRARCSAWCVSDNMLVLYVFWELTTVLSFLLVGHYAERATSRRGRDAGAAGDDVRRAGHAGRHRRARQHVRHLPVVRADRRAADRAWRHRSAIALVLVGALAKSAIVPMHFWLPGAMAAPTPVSAYLHAAAMVKAGVYLIARMSPGFADSPPWRPTCDPRRADHAAGRLAGDARIRPEVDPGVRHGQPARA